MPSLSSLITTRAANLTATETNLEQGRLFVFHAPGEYAGFRCNFCWNPTSAGRAVIEIWGSGGSGSRMCCCGPGVPGQAGGYSRRTVCFRNTGGFLTGNVGISCGNASALTFRGCSEATCIFLCTGSGAGNSCICMCAQGGYGGNSYCIDGGQSMWRCYCNAGFDREEIVSGGCGIIRSNTSVHSWGCAWGGDVNIHGGHACMWFYHCNACCACSFVQWIPIPAGIVSTCGAYVHVQGATEGDAVGTGMTGSFGQSTQGPLNSLMRDGIYGNWLNTCWNGGRTCQCYEQQGCISPFPYGMGGAGSMPCPGVRDHGWRGGNGAVRIKFLG